MVTGQQRSRAANWKWLAVLSVVTAVLGVSTRQETQVRHETEPTHRMPPARGDGGEPEASPTAVAAAPDGSEVYVACATGRYVAVVDTRQGKVVARIRVPGMPSGLTLSRNGTRLFVTCAAPESEIWIVETPTRRIMRRVTVGHTAMAPVLSPDERTLYVCNRFNNDLSVIDLPTGREVKRVPVEREPVAAAVTPDGKYLVVANHVHAESANKLHLSAAVTVFDTASLTVRKDIPLTLGAGLIKGVAVSPNGRFAAVTHLRSMYWLSTTAVELGRMNGNVISVIDLEQFRVLGMVFLDQTERGAANPWGVTWTPDGRTIAVACAGANALCLIDAPVIADRWSFSSARIGDYAPTEKGMAPLPRQPPVRVRKRISLPGDGPRALALVGANQLYVANYFSDDICRVDLDQPEGRIERLPLSPRHEPSLTRRGEMWFNDGRLCFQGWQSCASCHDSDGRTDALNWDLLNDGIDNPKNTRSLLRAHEAGPAMALGVRTNAEAAVRAGIHHILFTEQPTQVADAIDAWLKSLWPVPSPALAQGKRVAAAARGEKLFMSARTGCVECHPPPLFTDRMGHDVGTVTTYASMLAGPGADKPSDRFYSPPLVELWRTAPYLHDGSALTLRDVLTSSNHGDRHGRTSHLSAGEIDDLVAYLTTL